ncbi:hypothetical protein [Thermoflexus sp.]|jgi:hypothetical protein|uniref:hypothetical protein n=1 Tax=Thermoflexus sp. TaxID=1969742 RepID=UPI003C0BDA39
MSALLSYLPLRNQGLFARLFREAAEAVAKNFGESPLHEGKPLIAALPHSDGKADLVEIGGPFFYGKEDAIVNALIVLVGLLAADRPLCSPRRFVLNVESPDRVRWAVEAGGREFEGGPEPLDQALSRMSCAGEEEVPGNLLPHIPAAAKALPSWEVEHLRSCCLSLARGRYDHLLKITFSLAKEGTILARTCSVKPGSWAKLGPNVVAYRGHAAALVRELAKRIGELIETDLPEALVTRWGEMKVAITLPHVPPTKYLP